MHTQFFEPLFRAMHMALCDARFVLRPALLERAMRVSSRHTPRQPPLRPEAGVLRAIPGVGHARAGSPRLW